MKRFDKDLVTNGRNEENVAKMLKACDDAMNEAFRASGISLDNMMSMEVEEYAGVKEMWNIYRETKAYALEWARSQDRLEAKLDLINENLLELGLVKNKKEA